MLFKKFKKLVRLSLIGILIVISINLFTVAPPHTPQSSNSIKGVWLTHCEYSFSNRLVALPWTDPLSSAIKEGNRQGLKIYAWYEYGMMLNKYDRLAQEHPDWLLKTADETQLVNNNFWLNPAHPEVEKYWFNLLTEVAQKYPELAGVQLDDHFVNISPQESEFIQEILGQENL
ncbi:MAG TPA: family 10 glycosylhydrolase [Xenococcaceae cyanobacterium]